MVRRSPWTSLPGLSFVPVALALACGPKGDARSAQDARILEPPAPPVETGPEVETRNPAKIEPSGPAPAWAPGIDPQMLAVLEQMEAAQQPDPTTLTAFQNRNLVSPADAVLALLAKTGTPPMDPEVDVSHQVLPVGPKEGLLARIYTPADANDARPVVVYFHGGGWVLADLDTYAASAMALSKRADAIVVSVAYRLAPEHPFPAAHDDAYAAWTWVNEHAAEIGGDPASIAVAGESAGGNLAVAVAMRARDEGTGLPSHVLAIYPVADGDVTSPSYEQYAEAQPLSRPYMEWFFRQYLSKPTAMSDPRISLVDANLQGLPPVTIVNAEIDPLRSDGEELATRLREQGVEVEQRTFAGVTHEFFGMAPLLEQAEEAQQFAADRLNTTFDRQM